MAATIETPAPTVDDGSPGTPTRMPVDSTEADLKLVKDGLASVKQEIADRFESVERDVSVIKNSLNDSLQAMKIEAKNQTERSNKITEEFENAKIA